MKDNWVYNNELEIWHNLDHFTSLAVDFDDGLYQVRGWHPDGTFVNLIISDSKEECETFLSDIMKGRKK